MAYCPKCRGNYQIVVSTEGSTYSEPTRTTRYDWSG